MATTDQTTAIDNGGVKKVRNGDKSMEFRSADELLKLQRNQDKRAGRSCSFVRGVPKR